MNEPFLSDEIPPVEPPPVQLDAPEAPFLIQVDEFVRATQARTIFSVSGRGLCAAVLDTGLNAEHVDFAGRVVPGRNFTSDYGGHPDRVTDGQGHGTNVAGIIVAGGEHTGMAPGAQIAPLKVLRNDGGGSFSGVAQALDWVMAQRTQNHISVVCLSLSDGRNYMDDGPFAGTAVAARIGALRRLRVPVVVAAGNHYYKHGSQQGMAFPAILREAVSVGAVYDSDGPGFAYQDGAQAFSTQAGQVTPFSQRLHSALNRWTYTDIFAPGAPVTSSGINGPHGESIQSGTSQAAPVTAGIMLLLQDFWLREAGRLPTVNQLVRWLRKGGVEIVDSETQDDNVKHTGLAFVRLDAVSALEAAQRALKRD